MSDKYFDDKLQAWVTVCPTGAALGADDITNWSHRRALGMSGSDGWKERERAKKWAALSQAKRARRKLELKKLSRRD